MKNSKALQAGESGARSYKATSRTAGPEGPRDKVKGKTRQPGASGARIVSGKDVVADNQSRTAVSPVHNGKPIPAPTKSKDLFGEVCDLSPRGNSK